MKHLGEKCEETYFKYPIFFRAKYFATLRSFLASLSLVSQLAQLVIRLNKLRKRVLTVNTLTAIHATAHLIYLENCSVQETGIKMFITCMYSLNMNQWVINDISPN